MHLWDDYLYFEIVHPKTGEIVPDGEVGELVITTLKKEGAPLIRYRTHDLTRFIPATASAAAVIRGSIRSSAGRTTWSRSRA